MLKIKLKPFIATDIMIDYCTFDCFKVICFILVNL